MRVIYDKTKDNTVVSISTPTVLETVDNTDILINKEEVTSVLHTGIVGPQGAVGPAGGEDELAQAKRVDFIDSETLYRGEAVPGSADSAAVWRIRKITISAVDGDVIEKWADGTADYVKVWNSHLTYTYI